MPDASVIGPATLAMSQGVSAFTTFLPPLSEIRRANAGEQPDIAADVRMGEVAAASLTVSVGILASSLTESSIPVVTAIGVSVVMIVIYEMALRGDRPFESRGAITVPAEFSTAYPEEVA